LHRTWYDLFWAEWLGVLGFLITLGGFGVALRRLRKLRLAAEAARDASLLTSREVAAKQVAVLVPQLIWLADELDSSIETNDRTLTRHYLYNWRWQAGHVHGLLPDSGTRGESLKRNLQDSIGLAFTATTALMEGKRPVLDACKRARESIGTSLNDLSLWVGQESAHSTERIK